MTHIKPSQCFVSLNRLQMKERKLIKAADQFPYIGMHRLDSSSTVHNGLITIVLSLCRDVPIPSKYRYLLISVVSNHLSILLI